MKNSLVISVLAADEDLWMKLVTTKFHFKLAGGKLTEVTERARAQVMGLSPVAT